MANLLLIQELTSRLPAGVLIQSLASALEQHADKVKPYLGKALRHEHGFQALNTAMLHCGIFIYIPAGVCVEQPIVLSHWQDQNEQAMHNRCLIIAEEDSQATIIEDYCGAKDCNYFTNTVTEVFSQRMPKLPIIKFSVKENPLITLAILQYSRQAAVNLLAIP